MIFISKCIPPPSTFSHGTFTLCRLQWSGWETLYFSVHPKNTQILPTVKVLLPQPEDENIGKHRNCSYEPRPALAHSMVPKVIPARHLHPYRTPYPTGVSSFNLHKDSMTSVLGQSSSWRNQAIAQTHCQQTAETWLKMPLAVSQESHTRIFYYLIKK